jgi:hypothetical protein
MDSPADRKRHVDKRRVAKKRSSALHIVNGRTRSSSTSAKPVALV